MKGSQIHLHWNSGAPAARYRTGVSLHSHTLHSRESLNFIYRAAAAAPILAAAVRRGEDRYQRIHGKPLDLCRGWWTPPLGPREAWAVERGQVEGLDLDAIVSLTDHDDIEAPVSLQILKECRSLPISFEWTVPYGPTFFHLGVHNLPPAKARQMFKQMEEYTCTPRPARLGEILAGIADLPQTLTVFNHPLWDENRVGAQTHTQTAEDLVRRFGSCIHALEMNGLRPWRENRAVLAFAASLGKPIISGGDRHGLEPNANINLTNASNFAEFAAEVRSGWSDILILPHYRESHALRIVHNLVDILRTHERHANGWKLWSDRVFYECEDGRVRSLTDLFGPNPPASVAFFVRLVRFVSQPRVQRLLREAFSTAEGVAL